MLALQDIHIAINNLDSTLKITELKGAKAKLGKSGKPFVFVGGFNMVFQLIHNSKKWAFRICYVSMGENEERYLKISKYLTSKDLPYFAEFIYDEKGILINGELVDTIRMEWLDSMLLKEYIELNINSSDVLKNLANDFIFMCKELRENKISHGDLQEGNILITDTGKIKLVDYDSICIPEIEGQKELVTGLKGYQHPSRFNNKKTSLKADYFSELIIFVSILAIAEKPELWIKYKVKDTQYLLFTEEDFEDITKSNIYEDLKNISNKIDDLINVLIEYLKNTDYKNLNPFTTYLVPPLIDVFKTDRDKIIKGIPINIEWDVKNAYKVELNQGIGEVPIKGIKVLNLNDNTIIQLTAIGYFGSIDKEISISVFPTPIIKSLSIPSPDFRQNVILKIETPKFNLIKSSSISINNSINLSDHKMGNIQYSQNRVFSMIEINRIKRELNQQTIKYKLLTIYETIKNRLTQLNRK